MLETFHPAVRSWFQRRFPDGPTADWPGPWGAQEARGVAARDGKLVADVTRSWEGVVPRDDHPVRGQTAAAVELLATVLAEPRSAQQPFTANTPIKDIAAEALDGLRDALSPDGYSAALDRGTSTPFEVAAKELMTASIQGQPPAGQALPGIGVRGLQT